MKKHLKLLSLILVLVLALSACGDKKDDKKGDSGGKNKNTETEKDNQDDQKDNDEDQEKKDNPSDNVDNLSKRFPDQVTHDGDPLPDGEGVLRYGLVSSSGFKGLFNPVLYAGTDDSNIMAPTMWGTFMGDSEGKLRNGGPVELEFDKEAKTLTMKISDKYKWNDGSPVTARDFAYNYYIIGHGEYTGYRYGKDYKNVVGIEEYNWATTPEAQKTAIIEAQRENDPNWEPPTPSDTISGLKIIDEKTLQITFKNFGVDILWGSGMPYEPVPYEQLKDIPIAELEDSDAVRKHPLSCGPYYISNVVPEEKVEFKANEYYWNGKPHIPTVLMSIVNPDQIVASMKAGEYDIYSALAPSKYEEVKDLDNYTLLGVNTRSYSYLGFKLGKWDSVKSECVMDPDAKMNNLNLRKAMQSAIDINGVGESYMNGLSFRGSTIIPLPFKSFHDYDLKPVEYDPEYAMQLLDEAGYKDVDGDGFREDPNGQPLVIKVAHMSGSDITQKVADYYLQAWGEIGLKAEFVQGRLLEFNNFYDLVQADDPEIDVFFGGWNTGSNPECSGMYGREATWNFSRYTNDEFDGLLEDLSSDAAFDDDFRVEAYRKVQEHIYENVPISVTYYSYTITPVNKRVKWYDIGYDDGTKPFTSWADLQLTADKPFKAN